MMKLMEHLSLSAQHLQEALHHLPWQDAPADQLGLLRGIPDGEDGRARAARPSPPAAGHRARAVRPSPASRSATTRASGVAHCRA